METRKKSFVHNPGLQSEFIYSTIPSMLSERALTQPDKKCHVFLSRVESNPELSRVEVTWRELQARSLKIASAFLKMGLKPDDRIAISGRSIPEWLYVEYACTRIKVSQISIPVSLMYSDKLGQFLNDHKVKLLVLDPGYNAEIVQKISRNLPGFENLMKGDKSAITSGYPSGVLFLDGPVQEWKVPVVTDFLEHQLQDEDVKSIIDIQNNIDPDNAALVYATSGSTGIPKLLIHSHFTVINGVAAAAKLIGLVGEKSFFNDHGFGWLGSMHYYSLVMGITRFHLTTPTTDLVQYIRMVLNVIKIEKIDSAVLLTYSLQELRKLLQSGEIYLPRSLIQVITGGEKIPVDLVEYFSHRLDVFISYGSSETIMIGFLSTDRDGYVVGESEDKRLVYDISGPVQLKLVDDKGKCVPRGIPGYILTRQPFNFIGYLDDQEATAAAFSSGGWVGTGDMALMYDNGKYEVLGRTTDVIIKGTVKLYPSKQEEMLLRHDKLARAVVCSIPDDKYHEEICACVEPKSGCDVTVDELHEHCVQFQPPGITIPLYPFYFKIVKELPRNANGKVDKVFIRKMFLELANED